MLCLKDTSALNLYGDQLTDQSSLLLLNLLRCSDSVDCKSEEEIDRFIEQNKLLIVFN